MKGTTTQDRLWTGSFLRICLVNLFIFVNFHALLPTFTFQYSLGTAVGLFKSVICCILFGASYLFAAKKLDYEVL